MDIELLLAHPKQSGNGGGSSGGSNKNGRENRSVPMVIHHFQLIKTTSRYGSGAHPNLDLLADLVDRKSPSETSGDSAETFSVASSQAGQSKDSDSEGEEGKVRPKSCNSVYLKVKPKRKRASVRQLEILKKTFQQTPFPNSEIRKKLARELGMTVRSVQIWFQNQRQMARNLLPVKDSRVDYN